MYGIFQGHHVFSLNDNLQGQCRERFHLHPSPILKIPKSLKILMLTRK
ncbi:hypothetical protein MYAER_3321 [Microcystis aeruginosa NIES-2549]|uniref:Uncharacterized protein n=1 Tax=Microcystis aeruginosa NIES-2549 TaxID=1641812 RepID=A0A0F6U6K2_MICAE|nr:hypothetical protein MYAER_3321 [Microcystis aeruginosa NIES-2549]AOC54063.1 hypothetical protein amyaer_3358 [Microcystis aeruginosa NIES-2481]CCI32699.1 hypothetical protein MICAI_2710022 [Microcystis sp. T1-4]